MIRIFEDLRDDFISQASKPSSSWSASGGTITNADANYLEMTGNGSSATPYAYIAQTTAPIIGHQYYVKIRLKVTNANCASLRFAFGGASAILQASPVANTLYEASAIVVATSTDANSKVYHYYADAATANGKVMLAYDMIIIDLTLKYGAGLEQTKAFMDRIPNILCLQEVNGNVSLSINDYSVIGDKVLNPIKCIEVKQDNEDWYVEVECSTSYVNNIEKDTLLVVPTKEGSQPFRVGNIRNDGKRMSFKARHVGYDLENYANWYSFGKRWVASTLGHFRFIADYSIPYVPFEFKTDLTTSGWATYKEATILGAINEIRETFGGHIVFDWWGVSLLNTIGTDKGVTIRYGNNLEGAVVDESWDEVCTIITPYGNNNLSINNNGDSISATGVSYSRPYSRKITFQTDDETELIALATAYLEKFKVPKINYTVSSDNIQDVALGDTIKVIARQFTILTNVLGYTYNVLTQRITKVEFGNFRKDVKSVFSNIQGQFSELEKKLIQENIQINASLNPDWTSITPLASWAVTGDVDFQARLMKSNTIQIRGRLSGGTITAGTTIGMLPTSMVPTHITVISQATGAMGTWFLYVSTDRSIKVYGLSGTPTLHINAEVYP